MCLNVYTDMHVYTPTRWCVWIHVVRLPIRYPAQSPRNSIRKLRSGCIFRTGLGKRRKVCLSACSSSSKLRFPQSGASHLYKHICAHIKFEQLTKSLVVCWFEEAMRGENPNFPQRLGRHPFCACPLRNSNTPHPSLCCGTVRFGNTLASLGVVWVGFRVCLRLVWS